MSNKFFLENDLQKLVGTNLTKIRRMSDMIGFDFERSNTGKTNFKFSIHCECSCRLIKDSNVYIGNLDIYEPNENLGFCEDYNWDVSGANLFDEKAEKLNKYLTEKITFVSDVQLSCCKDLKISLTNNIYIEIFSNSSSNHENWVYFTRDLRTIYYSIGSDDITRL